MIEKLNQILDLKKNMVFKIIICLNQEVYLWG